MQCSQCGAAMRFLGKDTFSGDEIREYRCPACGHEDEQNTGKALWQIIHESNEAERSEAEKARKK